MKRMVALALVVVMGLVMVTGAHAGEDVERAEGIKEFARTRLHALVEFYEYGKIEFDADYINLLQSYLMMYMAAGRAVTSETNYEFKTLFKMKVMFDDTTRKTWEIEYPVYQLLEDKYNEWLRKEVSDKAYADEMVPMVKILIGEGT